MMDWNPSVVGTCRVQRHVEHSRWTGVLKYLQTYRMSESSLSFTEGPPRLNKGLVLFLLKRESPLSTGPNDRQNYCYPQRIRTRKCGSCVWVRHLSWLGPDRGTPGTPWTPRPLSYVWSSSMTDDTVLNRSLYSFIPSDYAIGRSSHLRVWEVLRTLDLFQRKQSFT